MSGKDVINALSQLKLSGMKDEYEHQATYPQFNEQPFSDRFLAIINAEQERRHRNKMDRMMKAAQFKYRAAPEEIDYSIKRGIQKSNFLEILKCDWIDNNRHLLITGPSGTGKTWLSCAIGTAAIRLGRPVRYGRVSRLLEEIQYARLDGSTQKLRKKLSSQALLIIDDFALHPLKPQERVDLFEMIEDRSSISSLIIIGQRPVADWYGYIKDPLLADAFMDRVQSGSNHLNLDGDSNR